MRNCGDMNQSVFKVLIPALTLLLSACSESGMGDLEVYVAKVKAEPAGQIDPLPEFKSFETYVYNPEGFKDPFAEWKTTAETDMVVRGGDNGIRPEATRQKEVLEGFPLDALKMLGTLEIRGVMWGLVKAPDGIVYRVKQGNYLGKNHGKIIAIENEKLALVEIVPNGLGGWEERPADLALNEQ